MSPDILTTARLVIAQQGDDAAHHYARERHRLSLLRADREAADFWRNIEFAIQDLLEPEQTRTVH